MATPSRRLATTDTPRLILVPPEEHFTLGEAEFGQPGLVAVESIGPFTSIQACGPLITVHDSVIEAGRGIGHHPHRYNERLFYLERGTFHHDDALNAISGDVPEGALARFTEGRRGMIHEEWNHGDVDAEIYILVASTDPIPEETSFEVLGRDRMPTYDEGAGATTTAMVGPGSPIPVSSDVRTFTDTRLEAGSEVDWDVGESEGALLSVREGAITIGGRSLGRKGTAVLPPVPERRNVPIVAEEASRVVRATFGPGHGLVMQ